MTQKFIEEKDLEKNSAMTTGNIRPMFPGGSRDCDPGNRQKMIKQTVSKARRCGRSLNARFG